MTETVLYALQHEVCGHTAGTVAARRRRPLPVRRCTSRRALARAELPPSGSGADPMIELRFGALGFALAGVVFDLVDQAIVDVVVLVLVGVVVALVDVATVIERKQWSLTIEHRDVAPRPREARPR
jgi:hypothetical protein